MRVKIVIAFAVLSIGTSALADRVRVLLSSRAVVDVAHLYNQYDGTIRLEACGHTEYQDGGVSPMACAVCAEVMPITQAKMMGCYKTAEGL